MDNVKIIKPPQTMTRAELLAEVERLRKGLEEEGTTAWCPICEDWYGDGGEMSPDCPSHDQEIYGLACDVRYDQKMNQYGYRWKEG